MDELPPPTQPPGPSPTPTPVVPLDYSPRDSEPSGWAPRLVRFLRRLSIAIGVAFVCGAILTIMFPRHDEEVVFLSFGVGLILLAIPLPKIPGW